MNRPFFAKRDLPLLIILLALILAAVYWFTRPADTALVAEIRQAGELVAEIPLQQAGTFTDLPGMVIETDVGRVRVQSADCPDQVCVHTGWISCPGEAAVCLPNRVSVTVRAAGDEIWIAG